MAEKKNQHYVPQFYLRLFSSDGKIVNLFHISSSKSILRVGIKGQCSKPYFYGEDCKQENAFGGLESSVARTIASISETKKLPDKQSKAYLELLFYILSQHNRTERAGEESNEAANKLLKDVCSFKYWRVVDKIPTAVPLSALASTWVFALDLEAKIICNRSKEPFITSDNPVIYYNQYMESCTTESCTGLASRGLQMFFPISPRILLHLYDPGVYVVEPRCADCSEISSDAEAGKVNELQWLSALKNVYYPDGVNQTSILSAAKRSLPRRPTNLMIHEEYPHPTDSTRTLIRQRRIDLKTRLRPSFIRIKKSMYRIPLHERESIRRPTLLVAWNIFQRQVGAGNYREDEFPKFLADVDAGQVKASELARDLQFQLNACRSWYNLITKITGSQVRP